MNNITFEQFEVVDIRIGTVIKADVPEWSHWVIRLEVDLGSEFGAKKCFSGIMKFFKPEDLIGKQFPFVVNLKPRTIGPEKEMSEAMMIMATPTASPASNVEHSSAGWQSGGQAVPEEEVPTVLFNLQQKVPNGTKVR